MENSKYTPGVEAQARQEMGVPERIDAQGLEFKLFNRRYIFELVAGLLATLGNSPLPLKCSWNYMRKGLSQVSAVILW